LRSKFKFLKIKKTHHKQLVVYLFCCPVPHCPGISRLQAWQTYERMELL